MNSEKTIVLIKPDGMIKGLAPEIIGRIKETGLSVRASLTLHVSSDWVRQLYAGEEDRWYFNEVIAWISSAFIMIILIEGSDAVRKVKFDVIGKFPNGIRGKYSESHIKNVAHSPDSIEAAAREMCLVRPFFIEQGYWPEDWS